MWKLSIEDDQANQTVVDLARDEYSVGRDISNTIRLTERNISRKHALVKRNGIAWNVQDLGSYNGCFVNGVRVSGDHPLRHGDLLQLGDYRLELVDDTIASPDPESKASTIPGRTSQTIRDLPNRLVMVSGPNVGASFPLLESKIVIGRGEDCDLPINDTSVSRVHSEIHTIEDGRWEIVDRDSSNGVRVNGVELKRALLDVGDVIELGDVQLRFVPAGQVFVPQEPPVGGSRRRSLEPGTGDGLGSARVRNRAIAIVAAIAAFAVVAAVALRRVGDEVSASASPEANPTARALEEARALLDRGDLKGALKKCQEVPEDSNLRESTLFKEIQTKWAESIFDQAAHEPDRSKKRTLLDQIAKSQDVGSIMRKRAANEIAALDSDSVGIDELPAAEHHAKPSEPTAAPTPQAPAASAPKKKNDVKGGLVRDTPF
jgi:pSer/pThr/pTyr-binding forkhead associated (FHA) protein